VRLLASARHDESRGSSHIMVMLVILNRLDVPCDAPGPGVEGQHRSRVKTFAGMKRDNESGCIIACRNVENTI